MLSEKIKKHRFAIILILISIFLVAGQSYLFSAYEAHVINVTARICKYSETRTIGFWKNHQEVYIPYIPTFLGDSDILTPEAADQVFQDADAVDMSDMLRAQLLAMKFNIFHYAVGEYFVIGWGTIDELVAMGDDALTPPYANREEMEEIKNALDWTNNRHRLTHCLDIDPGTEAPVFAIQGAPEPLQLSVESEGQAEIAGVMMMEEPAVEEPPVEEPLEESLEEPIEELLEEPVVEGPQEEPVPTVGEVVEEVIDVVEDVVETVGEIIIETIEDLLGLNEPVEEPPIEEPPVEEPPIEEPSAEPEPEPEPEPASEPPAEEPPIEELPIEDRESSTDSVGTIIEE